MEEIIDSRTFNAYRNKKLPRTEPLPSDKYLDYLPHAKKADKYAEWEAITR